MKHSVNFNNRGNKWDNALPIGNGVLGAMLYYEDGVLNMPMNHYEVYYFAGHNTMPQHFESAKGKLAELENTPEDRRQAWGKPHRDNIKKADGNVPPEGEPFGEYRITREEAVDPHKYAISNCSSSHPMTGDLSYTFDKVFDDCEYSLSLDVEDALVTLRLANGDDKLTMTTISARCDAFVQKVCQSKAGLFKSVKLAMQPYRSIEMPAVDYKQIDDSTFAYNVVRKEPQLSKDFTFSGIIRLVGAKGRLTANEYGCDIEVYDAGNEFSIVTGIFTDYRYETPEIGGLTEIDKWSASLDTLYADHREYWNEFFTRSSITLPDKFLEHIYYINQYALACCSGKDGVMKHQACGLNGLWDIKHPNIWGSSWYWDVNIQASFAGVFSSNRLDLGKVFSDGLNCYKDLARIYARTNHGLPGIAIDYPYFMYYSTWPWCAQYLWFQYEYSMDKEYLRNEAFPLFKELAEFSVNVFEYDEKTDTYNVYPDISPEQGPLTHNSVITVASVKYLLKFTIEAAEILGEESPLIDKCREVYSKMPTYPVSEEGFWGRHLKDSEDAPANMWIRHPSLLMPIYPCSEFDPLTCGDEWTDIINNTLDYLEDHTEIGVFQCSWLAAVAARFGRGQAALRILYEMGIDHMLRSNGLTAEETERFMNYCLIGRQPLWYPCMMEFTGEMLAAVNEMLMQSYNGIIRVFPAVPNTPHDWAPAVRHGRSLQECADRHGTYEQWHDVRFDKLLAKGAFEVSAEVKADELKWILVTSKVGGTARVLSPYMKDRLPVWCDGKEVESSYEDGIITFETEAGKSYLIAACACVCTCKEDNAEYERDILMRQSYTKRKIFIGEDPDTEYHKALDGAIRSWFMGNMRLENHTLYKFDFGCVRDKKYWESLTRQTLVGPERVMKTMNFYPVHENNMAFTPYQGYGFSNTDGIKAVDRETSDWIRRDLLEGTEPTEFIVESPRGQYEMLVVSGDESEENVTILETQDGYKAGGEVIKAGRYQCELIPMPQKKDVPMRLRISTVPGKKWKLNLMVLNIHKGY